MGDLESYLKKHANAQPNRGIAVSEHLSRVEYFYYGNLDLFEIKEPVYRNVLVRDDETGQTFGRISFIATDPTLSIVRFISKKTYKRDAEIYRAAFRGSAEYLSLRFNKAVKATLAICTPVSKSKPYIIRSDSFVVNGREISPSERYFEEMGLTLKGNCLVRV